MPPPKGRTAVLRSVALGYSTGAEAPQLPPGFSSRGSNFISALGGLSPRPGLAAFQSFSTASGLLGSNIGWVGQGSVDNRHYPVVFSDSLGGAVFRPGASWSTLSQTGAAGLSGNTLSTAQGDFIDATPYYHPTSDAMEMCFVSQSGGANARQAYTWRPENNSSDSLFSTLTNAPGAKYVVSFDNRLVFASIQSVVGPGSGGVNFPSRIQWSARGDPETYAAPDGGFEELLDARGIITRLIATEDRLIIFFSNEIWQGFKAGFPFAFTFAPLDRTVGTRHSWSVVDTPKGTFFLGNDKNLYIIPPGGAPQPVGGDVRRFLDAAVRFDTTGHPTVQAAYKADLNAYVLTFLGIGGGQQGVAVSLDNQATWSPLTFGSNISLRRFGYTSLTSVVGGTGEAGVRLIVGTDDRNVLELTSAATSDLGTAIDCRYLAPIGNPNPRERLFVRDVRVDYRCPSASSLSVRLSPDFGATFPIDIGVALPANAQSAQTWCAGGVNAVYPSVELRHASGHTFTIQGVTVAVEGMGNG